MTVSPNAACMDPFKVSSQTVKNVHWLPFASEDKSEVSPCDVDGYFVVEDSANGPTSTFRGRNLLGMNVNLGEFTCGAQSGMNASKVENLMVWNHDDVPLRSDVVPQCVSLARVQNFLGSLSNI